MEIVIDLQACQTESRHRGIGRYSLSLAKAIAAVSGEHRLSFALNGMYESQVKEVKKHFDGFVGSTIFSCYRYPQLDQPLGTLGDYRRHIAEALVRNHYAQLQPDILHISSVFEGCVKAVVPRHLSMLHGTICSATLYDLIPLIMCDHYLPNDALKRWFHQRIMVLKECNILLSISEASRRAATDYLGILPEKIVNISGAADAHFRCIDISAEQVQEFLHHYGIKEKFVLYTGATDYRKNVEGAISGYAKLPIDIRQQTQFVIVCAILPHERLRLLNYAAGVGLAEGEVVFTGFVPEDDLVFFYNLCTLFIFPSLYEGFGMPILEAMCCGAPVLGADNSSIPEIIGRQDAMFDSKSPEAIAAALYRGLTDEGFRTDLKSWSRSRAKEFNWKKSASKALAAFEETREKNISQSVMITAQYTPQSAKKNTRQYNAQTRLVLMAELDRVLARYNLSREELEIIEECAIANMPDSQRPRILIDVSLVEQVEYGGGIPRVVKKITAELCKKTQYFWQALPVCLSGGKLYRSERVLQGTNTPALTDQKIEVGIKEQDILLMLDTPWLYYEDFKEIFVQVRRRKGSVYTLVYDLIPVLYPPCLDNRFARWIESAAQESDGLVCISKTVADELITYMHETGIIYKKNLKIGYFHPGADISVTSSELAVRPQLLEWFHNERSPDTFLIVGTITPRKGYAFALDAFEKLWDSGVDAKLIIAGTNRVWGDFINRVIFHTEYGKRLLWVADPTDEEIIYCYRHAAALLFPSFAEGFGLPLVEAAQYDLPIICSDIPVFREVAAEYATYFSLESPQKLAEILHIWLRQPADLDVESMPRLLWAQSADKLIDIIVNNNWYKILTIDDHL